MRGIATNVVDTQVTPEALVAAAQEPTERRDANGAAVQVSWAFFASPSAFVVDLNAPGQATPIRLQMDLRNGIWQRDAGLAAARSAEPGQRADLRVHGSDQPLSVNRMLPKWSRAAADRCGTRHVASYSCTISGPGRGVAVSCARATTGVSIQPVSWKPGAAA